MINFIPSSLDFYRSLEPVLSYHPKPINPILDMGAQYCVDESLPAGEGLSRTCMLSEG